MNETLKCSRHGCALEVSETSGRVTCHKCVAHFMMWRSMLAPEERDRYERGELKGPPYK